jgi:hypothetical protein
LPACTSAIQLATYHEHELTAPLQAEVSTLHPFIAGKGGCQQLREGASIHARQRICAGEILNCERIVPSEQQRDGNDPWYNYLNIHSAICLAAA